MADHVFEVSVVIANAKVDALAWMRVARVLRPESLLVCVTELAIDHRLCGLLTPPGPVLVLLAGVRRLTCNALLEVILRPRKIGHDQFRCLLLGLRHLRRPLEVDNLLRHKIRLALCGPTLPATDIYVFTVGVEMLETC